VRRRDVGRRLVALPLLGVAGPFAPWVFALAYAVVPLVAAMHLAVDGRERFRDREAPRIAAALGWLLGVQAWSCLLAERLPLHRQEDAARLRLVAHAAPRPARAAGRLVTGLPGGVAVLLLAALALPAWLAAVAWVLVTGRPSVRLRRVLTGVLSAEARFLAVHASLAGGTEPRVRPRLAPRRLRPGRPAFAPIRATRR